MQRCSRADAHRHGAALAHQLGEHRVGVELGEHALADASPRVRSPSVRSTSCSSSRELARGVRRAALEVGLERLERAGVDQLAQLLLAEQLAQQLAVERERGGAALGVRRVALVHVGGDVVEQQRGGERRGARRLDLDERDLAPRERAQQRLAGPGGRARRAGTRGRSRG